MSSFNSLLINTVTYFQMFDQLALLVAESRGEGWAEEHPVTLLTMLLLSPAVIITSTNIYLFYDVYLMVMLTAYVVAPASIRCFVFWLLFLKEIMRHFKLHTFTLNLLYLL